MIPVLFPPGATEWTTQGIGALSDAISCNVVEERNGEYELELKYPVTGVHYGHITDRSIILANPSPYREPQPFSVYRSTKPLDGICTFYARHISYDLAGVPLNPFDASNAPAAMAGLQNNAAVESPFRFWTDKATVAHFSVPVPIATRSMLGGRSGSILDVYGGEYEWDGFTVKLYQHRGHDNGVTIRYGKNLTDIEQDRNIANVYTGLYPYWTDSDGKNLVTCEPKIVPAPGTYSFTNILTLDFSQDFEEPPTKAQLKTKAESYIKANKVGIPKVRIKASFVQLEQTEEYKHLALLEKCDLCDTVTIQFEQLGIDVKAQIVKIETDVLLDRYTSVEIGEARANISDTIAQQQQTVDRVSNPSFIAQAATDATKLITGGKGGYVVIHSSTGSQKPDEILIMDTPDIATARKVWRWNQGGLGYSKKGYNGPYELAVTQDGAIVADFITTGTLNASQVKVINLIADHLRSESGNLVADIWAGVFKMLDADNVRARLYMTGVDGNTGGILQLFSGDITEDGTKGDTCRYTYLTSTSFGLGEKPDGTFDGTISTKNLHVENVMMEGRQILSNDGSGNRVGHFDKLALAGGFATTVDWVWDPKLGCNVLAAR